MMNGILAKFAAIAALLLLILMADFPATSGLNPVGGEEFYGSRKTFSKKGGCFGIGCQRMDLFHNKDSRMLGLSLRSLQPPPSPTKGQVHIWSVPPAPPPPASLLH